MLHLLSQTANLNLCILNDEKITHKMMVGKKREKCERGEGYGHNQRLGGMFGMTTTFLQACPLGLVCPLLHEKNIK